MIGAVTRQGINVRHACRCLGVTESGYYAWRSRPTSPRAPRRIFLAGEIVDVHRASAGVYGSNRVTAELRFGREIIVGHNAVAAIMRELGIRGLPPVAYRALRGSVGLAVRISCAVHSVEHSQISCG